VKFKSKILPGDTLEIHSAISFEKAEKAIVTCTAEVFDNGVSACTGDVTLAMR
jgi:3-hydroxymyristoyl/3-hydroxydecanoyl-(acyl carrier protein) dehydratases